MRDADLNRADVLASFANLKSEEVEDFRKHHPNFAPDKWWDYQPNATKGVSTEQIKNVMANPAIAHLPPHLRGDLARMSVGVQQASDGHSLPKQWLIAQGRLYKVWERWNRKLEVNLSQLVQLLASVFDPDMLIEKQYASERRPTYADVTELDKKWDFHKAVEFLAGSSWRAKICHNPRADCRRKFVANTDKAMYCSLDCINDGRRESVLENFHRHKQKYRPKTKAKKRKRMPRMHIHRT